MVLIDTNVFIQCSKYAPSAIFISLWAWLENNQFNPKSIEAVFQEINSSNTVLYSWASGMKQKDYFIDNHSQNIQNDYQRVVQYVNQNYQDSTGRDAFLDKADAWLIATALSLNYSILTFEKPEGENDIKPKIPNVATYFGVPCHDFFDFLKTHQVQF